MPRSKLPQQPQAPKPKLLAKGGKLTKKGLLKALMELGEPVSVTDYNLPKIRMQNMYNSRIAKETGTEKVVAGGPVLSNTGRNAAIGGPGFEIVKASEGFAKRPKTGDLGRPSPLGPGDSGYVRTNNYTSVKSDGTRFYPPRPRQVGRLNRTNGVGLAVSQAGGAMNGLEVAETALGHLSNDTDISIKTVVPPLAVHLPPSNMTGTSDDKFEATTAISAPQAGITATAGQGAEIVQVAKADKVEKTLAFLSSQTVDEDEGESIISELPSTSSPRAPEEKRVKLSDDSDVETEPKLKVTVAEDTKTKVQRKAPDPDLHLKGKIQEYKIGTFVLDNDEAVLSSVVRQSGNRSGKKRKRASASSLKSTANPSDPHNTTTEGHASYIK